MNRSADWLHQAQADLDQALVSARARHHEWACFACHQAAEKALKALHLSLGQQVWGHGLGRCFRDLPPSVCTQLGNAVTDLEDRLRILDALYIPPATPIGCPMGLPPTISVACKATGLFAMPVRSLTQSVMRWPEREHVLRQVQAWAKEQVCRVASLERVAVFGSYGWGTAGVGSDLDLLLIDAAASGPQHERLLSCSRPNRAFPASSSGMPCGCGVGG